MGPVPLVALATGGAGDRLPGAPGRTRASAGPEPRARRRWGGNGEGVGDGGDGEAAASSTAPPTWTPDTPIAPVES